MALARHLRSLEEWASARPQYRLAVGYRPLPFEALTDEAIADLRSTIASDMRFEREINRRNRELRATASRINPQFVARMLGGSSLSIAAE